MRHLFHHSGRDSTRGKQKGGAGKRPLSPLRQDAEQEPILLPTISFLPVFPDFESSPSRLFHSFRFWPERGFSLCENSRLCSRKIILLPIELYDFLVLFFLNSEKGCWSGVMGKFYLYSRLVSSCNRYTIVGKSILFKKRR